MNQFVDPLFSVSCNACLNGGKLLLKLHLCFSRNFKLFMNC